MMRWFTSNAKRIADTITAVRAVIALTLLWLGWEYGAESLPVVVWLMLIDWTGDSLDGAVARCNRPLYHSWVGDHDLGVDILVAAGLLGYLVYAGFVMPLVAGLYVLTWFLILWHWQMPRTLGMLCQAPVYGWFVVVAVYHMPTVGVWLLVWIIVAMSVTWPRFPQEIVPNFLAGMRHLRK